MNFRRLTEAELADFAQNVNTLLGGALLTAIDTNVRADLAAAIGTLPATLATQAAAAAVAEAERKASVSQRNTSRSQVRSLMSQVRDALKAGLAPKDQYDLCGFDFPTLRSTYEAVDPTKLSAFGYSNGVNVVRFSGNNKPGQVIYEVWRRHGDTAAWALHATTKSRAIRTRALRQANITNIKCGPLPQNRFRTFQIPVLFTAFSNGV